MRLRSKDILKILEIFGGVENVLGGARSKTIVASLPTSNF